MEKSAVPYRALFSLIAVIFGLRILAQLGATETGSQFLPAFSLWHSSTMPYWALLTAQLVILALIVAAIFAAPFKTKRPALGAALISLGWIYVAVLVTRLVIGVFDLSALTWFDGAISTAFHFVLASFVLLLGSAWRDRTGDIPPIARLIARYAGYPALIVGGYALFVWLVDTGSPLLFSSYLAAAIATFGILLHETFVPAREEWRPHASDVANDGLFLTFVQVGLPLALRAGALALIVWIAETEDAPLGGIWPTEWPVLAQVLLMLVIAEFFRYWIHRTLHTVGPLWRLHAVHHASTKLYTINVGRFHPLDKSLQFLGDTLPFLLLGVAPEVFAVYFVLYAINGFYQHSNADVRLGPLNWIVAGPELHRWHHSAELDEAMSNYGNNLIVWDTVFGTRFLPTDRKLGRIGIQNPHWPHGFLAQMAAPFTTSTEAAKD
ncbi:MAG: sterol desaturase family protein [Pseudomonadota bacterium]